MKAHKVRNFFLFTRSTKSPAMSLGHNQNSRMRITFFRPECPTLQATSSPIEYEYALLCYSTEYGEINLLSRFHSNIISEKSLLHIKLTSVKKYIGGSIFRRLIDFFEHCKHFRKFGELGRKFPRCNTSLCSTRFCPVVHLLAWQRFVRLDAHAYELGALGLWAGGRGGQAAVTSKLTFWNSCEGFGGNC